MRAYNFKENNEDFESLASPVVGSDDLNERIKSVTPMQLRSGQLVKFTYSKTGRAYTALVAATPRAPYGHYTTANTHNSLVTMFLLYHYSKTTQTELVKELYGTGINRRRKMVSYKPQAHLSYFSDKGPTSSSRMATIKRFWTNVMNKINLRVKSNTELKSQNFRTFLASQMIRCKVLK